MADGLIFSQASTTVNSRTGVGFAEMPNKEEADKAISGLNGKDLKDRPLTVNEAQPSTDRPRTGGGRH